MTILKVSLVCGIGVCFEKGYAYEGIAGVSFVLLVLITYEARKKWKKS
jgi:hypothetical protein